MYQKTLSKNVDVYMEASPNPNSIKFVCNRTLVDEDLHFDFANIVDANDSPLARELFTYPFVERVFFMNNFVTVTKSNLVEWIEVQQVLKKHIKNFLENDKQVIVLSTPSTYLSEEGQEASATIEKIKEILDEYVKPAVEQDGGAIIFHAYTDGILQVRLQGACSGCPASTITLKLGIENLFKKMMPNEVRAVEAISQ